MAKILAVGAGPLMESGVRVLGAHALRTWNLVAPLLAHAHEVALFTVPIFDFANADAMRHPGVAEKTYRGFAYSTFLNADAAYNFDRLSDFCQAFRPDCILGIAHGPTALAARLPYPAPLWADLFGHLPVEAQAKAFAFEANTRLHDAWRIEQTILQRADHFSTCSRRQRYALYGELGAIGRLNRQTFHYEFASFMPPAFDPFHAEPPEKTAEGGGPTFALPDDAFVVLWSGGYNTWTNIEALAEALDLALEQCPRLHFVSTGGPLFGHDEVTYPRFESLMARGAHRERCHLLGWIDAAELPAIYARGNLALCVDSRNLETMFGTRTRIVNLLAAGVPVLATRGSELVEDLEAAGCLLVCEPDDARVLGQAMIEAERDAQALKSLGQKARAHVLSEYSFARNTEALCRWVAEPGFAPDNEEKLRRQGRGDKGQKGPKGPKGHKEDQKITPICPLSPLGPLSPFDLPLSPLEKQARLLAMPPRESAPLATSPRCASIARRLRRFLRVSSPAADFSARELNLALDDASAKETLAQALASAKPPQRLVLAIDSATVAPALQPTAALERIRRLGALAPEMPIRLHSNLANPLALEALCESLLDGALDNPLETAIEVHGLEARQDALGDHSRSWVSLLYMLARLGELARLYPGRFRLIAAVQLHAEGGEDVEPLCQFLRKNFDCIIEFQLPAQRDDFPPPGQWGALLRLIRHIDEEQPDEAPQAARIRRRLLQRER